MCNVPTCDMLKMTRATVIKKKLIHELLKKINIFLTQYKEAQKRNKKKMCSKCLYHLTSLALT